MIKTSVIITNHNYEKFLGRCIRSCLNQSMPDEDYEVIVVDDASTDKSREVIESFGDEIVPIFLKKNCGVAYASNEGIKKAKGMFIMRVDADDFVNENMLLFMSEILSWNQDLGFVYCDHFRVDENGEKLERVSLGNVEKLYNHGAGIMFRKLNLEALGLYDIDLENCEDYDLLIRYFKNFDGYYLKLPLYRYTRHEKNMTKDKEARKYWKDKVKQKHRE